MIYKNEPSGDLYYMKPLVAGKTGEADKIDKLTRKSFEQFTRGCLWGEDAQADLLSQSHKYVKVRDE